MDELLLTGTEDQEPGQYQGITLCSKSWIYELCEELITDTITECDAKDMSFPEN